MMASTLPLPLMSIVDSSHYVRGHGHSHSHQPHRSRKVPQRSPLSRIPSERLDPRWMNGDNYNDNAEPPDRCRDDDRHASMDRIAFPPQNHTVPSPRNDTFIFPKGEKADVQDQPRESDHHTHNHIHHHTHHHESHHNTEKAQVPVARMEEKARPLPSILAGLAMAAPFVLLPLFSSNLLMPYAFGPLSSTPKVSTSNPLADLFLVLILTSSTLILSGLYGCYRRPGFASSGVPSSRTVISQRLSGLRVNPENMRHIASRLLAIALPFAAALQYGSSSWLFLVLCMASSGLIPDIRQRFDLHYIRGWKSLLRQEGWALGAAASICAVAGLFTARSASSAFIGLFSISASIFVFHPPYRSETGSTGRRRSADENAPMLPTPKTAMHSRLVDSAEDTTLTLAAGFTTLTIAAMVYLVWGASLSTPNPLAVLICSSSAASSYIYTDTRLFRGSTVPLMTGLAAAVAGDVIAFASMQIFILNAIVAFIGFLLVAVGKKASAAMAKGTGHGSDHLPKAPSKTTVLLLNYTERYALLHGILANRKSRRIFYFMLLNLAFMMVQTTYGFLTGSLGLIGDSIHMFFDCMALMMGVSAAVMSKWPPSVKFPYGYGKIDTLAGFGNGTLLVLISGEIMFEAFERLAKGSEVSRETELFVISTLGLVVNIIGIFAFHSHDDHSHGHEKKSQGPAGALGSDAISGETVKPKKSAHESANMRGIYLHIMADIMGSVAVMVSTVLIYYTGWSGWDPIASSVIAIMIAATAIPLVTSTGEQLLLSLPSDVEYVMRDTLCGLSAIRGVAGYKVPKFWMDDSEKKASGCHHSHSHGDSHDEPSPPSHGHSHDEDDTHSHHKGHTHSHHDHSHESSHRHDHHDSGHPKAKPIHGTIHVQATKDANLDDVRQGVLAYLHSRNIQVTVHVEREGDLKCWCAGS